jgi:molybdate transport system regulatory protein
MPTVKKEARKACARIWLEFQGKPVIGKGGADILEAIGKVKSISGAARELGMSYRYVWNYLRNVRRVLKRPIVKTFRGGRDGGGAVLTEFSRNLLRDYRRMESYVSGLLEDEEYWEAVGLKISARNRLRGTVQDVEKGVITAKVKVKIDDPVVITAIISKEAVEELDIKRGEKVEAVVKATEVMIAKEKPN